MKNNHTVVEVPENEARIMRAETIEKKIQKKTFLDLKDLTILQIKYQKGDHMEAS